MQQRHFSPAPRACHVRGRHAVSPFLLRPTGAASGPTAAADLGERARGLRCANSRASSRARREPGTISHPGGRGAESRCLSMGGAETHALAPVLATTRRAPRARRQPLGAPFARSNGSGTPSTMRTVSTLTGTIRRIAAIRTRGWSNHQWIVGLFTALVASTCWRARVQDSTSA